MSTQNVRPASTGASLLVALMLSAATFALLLAPDLHAASMSEAIQPLTKTTPFIILAVAAALITLSTSAAMRTALIAFFALNQIIWLGCLAYFGQIMTPDQFLLAPFETADVAGGILSELDVLLASAAPVAACAAVLLILHGPVSRRLSTPVLRHWSVNVLALMSIIGIGVYWFAHKKFSTAYPGAWTPSIIGPYQSAVGAFRMARTSVSAGADLGVRDQVVKPAPLPDEPITVAVIMGESVSATRLGILGYAKDTTPRLSAWATSPPRGFRLFHKQGFSGGVATFASVPSFLRLSYWPMQAERRGVGLFQLARSSGFKKWYLSAQAPVFLNLAGGAPFAEEVLTSGDLVKRFGTNNDDGLVTLAEELPDDVGRRFVFFHQRVNHSDYAQHCRHVTPSIDIEPVPEEAARAVRAPIAYDNGIRCWDRNVAGIAEKLLGSPGAVYVFVTSDHAELVGEGGLWGHSMADLKAAEVPYLLLTNRPESEVARRFQALEIPTTYRVAQIVALALGHEVTTPGISDDTFFLNTTMPLAQAGYMRVDRLASGDFKVRTYSSNGQLRTEAIHDSLPRPSEPAAAEKPHVGL